MTLSLSALNAREEQTMFLKSFYFHIVNNIYHEKTGQLMNFFEKKTVTGKPTYTLDLNDDTRFFSQNITGMESTISGVDGISNDTWVITIDNYQDVIQNLTEKMKKASEKLGFFSAHMTTIKQSTSFKSKRKELRSIVDDEVETSIVLKALYIKAQHPIRQFIEKDNDSNSTINNDWNGMIQQFIALSNALFSATFYSETSRSCRQVRFGAAQINFFTPAHVGTIEPDPLRDLTVEVDTTDPEDNDFTLKLLKASLDKETQRPIRHILRSIAFIDTATKNPFYYPH